MMPVPVDPVSLTAYAAFPPELDRDWLGRICHLSEPDLALVRRRADPVTQLGYATQLVTVRTIGTFCLPIIETASGSRPVSPGASRSASVKAVPRFSSGDDSTAQPHPRYHAGRRPGGVIRTFHHHITAPPRLIVDPWRYMYRPPLTG